MKKLKGLDFWGAARITDGTKRGIKYKNSKIWWHIENKTGGIFLSNNLNEGVWWPNSDERKEKAWEVGPPAMTKENWPGKPKACDCGCLFADVACQVLTCVDTDNRPAYLEVWCRCGKHLLVDTEGNIKQVVEY